MIVLEILTTPAGESELYDSARRMEFHQRALLIGHRRGCDLILPGKRVAPVHVRLELHGDMLRAIPGERAPVQSNGVSLPSDGRAIANGDLLLFGGYQIRCSFRAGDRDESRSSSQSHASDGDSSAEALGRHSRSTRSLARKLIEEILAAEEAAIRRAPGQLSTLAAESDDTKTVEVVQSTSRADDSGGAPPADQPLLFVKSGPAAGKWLSFTRRSAIRVGRGEHCDLDLLDRQVSREPFLVALSEQGLTLHPNETKNPIRISGQRLTTATPLNDGDVIEIGKSCVAVFDPLARHQLGQTAPAANAQFEPVPRAKENREANFSASRRIQLFSAVFLILAGALITALELLR